MTDGEKWYLECFAFGAQVVRDWKEQFPAQAEVMVAKGALVGDWSPGIIDAFRTAFGG